jgi:hypothetical protein
VGYGLFGESHVHAFLQIRQGQVMVVCQPLNNQGWVLVTGDTNYLGSIAG